MNTVIFDLGKVLVEYDWKHLMDRFGFDEKTYQKVAEAIFLSDNLSYYRCNRSTLNSPI